MRGLLITATLLFLGACILPTVATPIDGIPTFEGLTFTDRAGMDHPVRRWSPAGEPSTVLIAVHGFNDYANFFDHAGNRLSHEGVLTYATDHRGFGHMPDHGRWPGVDVLLRDLKDFASLIRARHPDAEIIMLGESMGGGLTILANSGDAPTPVDRVILSAPAVWSRATMPFYQRWALWLAERLIPSVQFTGKGLKIQASDNIPMLRAWGADPLIIKNTRVETMSGISDVMDAALQGASDFRAKALILYGAKDQVIPKPPIRAMLGRLPEPNNQRLAYYPDGWHMLMRDLQNDVVIDDIAAWIKDGKSPLPSGFEVRVLADAIKP